MDQSPFAAPHGLSQRTTSFIASQRQGIHRTPLSRLIALMIDARHGTTQKGHPCPLGAGAAQPARRQPARHGEASLRKTFRPPGNADPDRGQHAMRALPSWPASPSGRACRRIRSGSPAHAEPLGLIGPTGCIPLHDVCRSRRRAHGPRHTPMDPSSRSSETDVTELAGHADPTRAPGGARRDRTDDLLLAKQALSQLSYGPIQRGPQRPPQRRAARRAWWAWDDSNVRPHPYQGCALTN